MTRSRHWIVLLLALFLGSVTRLNAQKLESGTWTGAIVDPGGESVDVTYLVLTAGDTLKISLAAPEGHSAEFTNIRFEGGNLLFSWEPGIQIDCVLMPGEAGSFSGACTDASGESGHMTMAPPKK
ncbi:MAG: hypothetical protein ABI613_04415 [Gemmatimonadota bacterium]